MTPLPETYTTNQKAEWGYVKGFLEKLIGENESVDSVSLKTPKEQAWLLEYLEVKKLEDLRLVEKYRSTKNGETSFYRVLRDTKHPGLYFRQKQLKKNQWGGTAIVRLGRKVNETYLASIETKKI